MGLIGAKDAGCGNDSWSCKTCKAPVKMSPPQTTTHFFTGRMPFLSPNRVGAQMGKHFYRLDVLLSSNLVIKALKGFVLAGVS